MTAELTQQIAQLISALGGDGGWLLQVVAVMGAARVFFKFAAEKLQRACTEFLAYVHGSKTTDDDTWVVKLLSHPLWWLFAFGLDFTLSVKLPSLADFEKLNTQKP